MINCMIKKTCRGYLDAFKSIRLLLNEFSAFITSIKLSKGRFILLSLSFSMITTEVYLLISYGTTSMSKTFVGTLEFIFGIIAIPLILIPLYSAFYDCYVDEDMKI